MGKLFSVGAESSPPFLILLLPEKLLGSGGIRPIAFLFWLPDQAQGWARHVNKSGARLQTGCLCLVSGETWAGEAPCQSWSAEGSARSGEPGRGQRHRSERGQGHWEASPQWALGCNLKPEEAVKKEILRQGKNRRDLETRKMRVLVGGVREYLGNSNCLQKANVTVF